jgi:HD-like signal output (HDOD) protein
MPNFDRPSAPSFQGKAASYSGKNPAKTVADTTASGVGAIMQDISQTVGINMRELIVNKIKSLPPLPKTVIEVNRIRNSDEPDNRELIKVLKEDAAVTFNIFKLANSSMYGFSGKIKTLEQALSFFGFNMVTNIAISTAIIGHLKPNLGPYGVDMESFNGTSSIQSKIIEKWIDPKINGLKNELQFAAFLQEVGIIIFSIIILENNLTDHFKDAIEKYQDQSVAENMMFGHSSSEVTSMMFSHWKFNKDMIDYIRHADKPENAEELFKVGSQALKIAKILAPIGQGGITKDSIARATELAQEYDFDPVSFEKLTDWIQDRKEDEEINARKR